MALWVCEECTTRYAVGLSRCPRCHCTEFHEEGAVMPKISKQAGPSFEPEPEPTPIPSPPEDADHPRTSSESDHPEPDRPEAEPEKTGTVSGDLPPPETTTRGSTSTRRTGRGST